MPYHRSVCQCRKGRTRRLNTEYKTINIYNIMAQTFTDANFEELVLKSDKVALVDFWAQWCGPCLALGPTIEEIANEYQGKAVVGKVNVDECPAITKKYGIRNIPTILFIKNGEVVDKQVGKTSKADLVGKLDAQL